ncbi:MAG: 30S ribosomal protein S16 [Candidatus Levybacteria bacterium CG10_big_fil_rev_8_21_14_0_10_36_7]|nr:MAG: 30S ribosomal protein S16 [Candidatus Levybacteria bacterium CG10_big_fil_rev_8_21_14_0_10_36_7]
MSLVIRFAKTGRKGERKFRIVVKEKRSRRDGDAVDTLGYYIKVLNKEVVKKIDQEKLDYWMSKGAQMSASVKKNIFPNKS